MIMGGFGAYFGAYFLYEFDKGKGGTGLDAGLELVKETSDPSGTFGSHPLRTYIVYWN
jgi:hypothetical protein